MATSQIAPIRPIEENSRRRIVAGQAVFDLSSAVKELVDNSLDAGSKSINVRLFNQGIDIVEVSDDGCGIPVESRPYIATAHATSKISAFEDIYNPSSEMNTLGFRGEALFCLANLSSNLVVATRTASEPLGQKLNFQRDGSLRTDSVAPIARKVGTTVAIVGLLEAVPVRRADLIRRISEQRRKLVRLLAGYAIFAPGVKLQLIDILPNGNERMLLGTTSNTKTLRDTISIILGTKTLSSLKEFEVDLCDVLTESSPSTERNEENDSETQQNKSEQNTDSPTAQWHVRGYISKIPNSSNSGERLRDEQCYSINKRPVDLPRFSRMFNEVWRSLGVSSRSHPCCVLEFTLPRDSYDINVSPDKREVIFPKAQEMLAKIQDRAIEFWSSQMDGQFESAPALEAPSRTSAAPSEPQTPTRAKFNRRYAFSHDVKNIRLQHEFDDGRVKSTYEHFTAPTADDSSSSSDEEESRPTQEGHNTHDLKETPSTEAPSAAAQSDTDSVGSQSPENAEVGDVDSSVSSPHSTAPPQTEQHIARTVHQERSPVEDRIWRQARQRLHQTTESATRRAELGTFEQFLAPSTSSSSTRRKRKAAPSQDSYNLEQFGFQVKKRPSNNEGCGRTQQGQTNLPSPSESVDRPSKRVSFDSATPWDSTRPTEHIATEEEHTTPAKLPALSDFQETCDEGSGGSKALADIPEDEDESTGRVTVDETETGSDSSPINEKATISKNGAVVWSTFNATEAVIGAARKERVAMEDRKLRFHADESSFRPRPNEDVNSGKISLKKTDFQEMEVIGQFNMGFILAKSPDNNLWILDQHACDEKQNFEKLVAETVIHEQPLIAPMSLELSHSEESCILDNMEIFEKNGFRFRYDEKNPPRRRLSLTAIPHSGARDGRKAVQFGKEDVSALCAILGADDTGTSHDATAGSGTGADGSGSYGNNAVRRYVKRSDKSDRVIARLPKAIAMFASRACRGSIMIGKSLSVKEMDRVVKKMADVEHPWNCPHGRPTMRHLADFRSLNTEDERAAASHLAGPTVMVMSQDLRDHEVEEEV